MRDDNYNDDDDNHDTVVAVPQTELVAIRFWLRNIYGFLFPSFRSPVFEIYMGSYSPRFLLAPYHEGSHPSSNAHIPYAYTLARTVP